MPAWLEAPQLEATHTAIPKAEEAGGNVLVPWQVFASFTVWHQGLQQDRHQGKQQVLQTRLTSGFHLRKASIVGYTRKNAYGNK